MGELIALTPGFSCYLPWSFFSWWRRKTPIRCFVSRKGTDVVSHHLKHVLRSRQASRNRAAVRHSDREGQGHSASREFGPSGHKEGHKGEIKSSCKPRRPSQLGAGLNGSLRCVSGKLGAADSLEVNWEPSPPAARVPAPSICTSLRLSRSGSSLSWALNSATKYF